MDYNISGSVSDAIRHTKLEGQSLSSNFEVLSYLFPEDGGAADKVYEAYLQGIASHANDPLYSVASVAKDMFPNDAGLTDRLASITYADGTFNVEHIDSLQVAGDMASSLVDSFSMALASIVESVGDKVMDIANSPMGQSVLSSEFADGVVNLAAFSDSILSISLSLMTMGGMGVAAKLKNSFSEMKDKVERLEKASALEAEKAAPVTMQEPSMLSSAKDAVSTSASLMLTNASYALQSVCKKAIGADKAVRAKLVEAYGDYAKKIYPRVTQAEIIRKLKDGAPVLDLLHEKNRTMSICRVAVLANPENMAWVPDNIATTEFIERELHRDSMQEHVLGDKLQGYLEQAKARESKLVDESGMSVNQADLAEVIKERVTPESPSGNSAKLADVVKQQREREREQNAEVDSKSSDMDM